MRRGRKKERKVKHKQTQAKMKRKKEKRAFFNLWRTLSNIHKNIAWALPLSSCFIPACILFFTFLGFQNKISWLELFLPFFFCLIFTFFLTFLNGKTRWKITEVFCVKQKHCNLNKFEIKRILKFYQKITNLN